jgi:FKBP-type peptidyl-prolyl cis-trans isomerase
MQQSDSGLLYRIIGAGAGVRPRVDDTVVVTLLAKAPDGQTDLPQLSRENARMKVSEMLPGLAEGVQRLALGGTEMLVLPPSLSFGNGEWPQGLQPGMPLLFQIELKEVAAHGTEP